jgi:hypothetical protein
MTPIVIMFFLSSVAVACPMVACVLVDWYWRRQAAAYEAFRAAQAEADSRRYAADGELR